MKFKKPTYFSRLFYEIKPTIFMLGVLCLNELNLFYSVKMGKSL